MFGSIDSFTGLDFQLGAQAAQPQTEAGLWLSNSIHPSMATPDKVTFRRNYQRHRMGVAVVYNPDPKADDEHEGADSFGSALMEEALKAGGVHGREEIYENEQGYNELLKWRLSYQAHRSGASRGAKGEIGAGLSVHDVRMLPVARLAAHRRALARISERKAQMSGKSRLSALHESPDEQPAETDAEEPAGPHPTHVHVGAGRLGLGLLVPALARTNRARGGTLVLLQRPSDAWAALAHGAVVAFTVNQQPVCALRVMREMPAEGLEAWRRGGGEAADGLLVLSEEEAVLDAVAAAATSLSTSLGPALGSGLAPLLGALGRRGAGGAGAPRLRLYAAENDHAAVEKLAAMPALLGGLDGMGIKAIPLLVDRVCTSRTITPTQVDTGAEEWAGEIVAMAPPADDADDDAGADADAPTGAGADAAAAAEAAAARRRLLAEPPFGGEGVRWPKSEAEAHFLHRRKILTVNGTHTTLAFHTLAVHEPPPHTGLPHGDYELLRAVAPEGGGGGADCAAEEEADEDAALQAEETWRMAWSWVVARQLLLLYETDALVATAALGCEGGTPAEAEAALADALLAGARVALRRLGRGGDTTRRVLGGGVVNRFQTRLKPIASFLDASLGGGGGGGGASRWLRGSLPRRVLRRAKLTESAMRLAVLGLAKDAERFTVDASAAAVDGGGGASTSATPKPSPAKMAGAPPSPAAVGTPAAKLPQSAAA